MRGQQPGVSQPRLGFSDMQLLQQQYFSKQFQELQRQHQLQQLDQGARPQNLQSQFSALTAQTAGDQLSVVVDGTPIRDSPNYMWSNERAPQVGVDPKMLNSSQLFILGNPSMARTGAPAVQGFSNGLGLQQENTHALRSMGFIPQQLDQSMYGTSFGGIRESSGNLMNPYSSVQWGAHGSADLLMKASGNQDQKTVIQSNAFGSFHGDQSAPFSGNDDIPASKHSYHGKNIFSRPQGMHSGNSGIHPGNFQPVASSPRNSQIQEFHGRVEHTGWPGTVEEKVAPQVGPPQGGTSLDPLEEKILYGGDDNAWNGIRSGQPLPSAFGGPNSMNTGGFVQNKNQLDSSDYFNMFPSIQSGSWSALMQSAVAEASSSDTGMQDEWSGLSYQKVELSTGNPSELNESGRQSTGWNEANAETPSSLPPRSFHLFDDATMSTGGQSGREYQQITPKPTYSQSGKVDCGIPRSQNFMHNNGPSDSLGKSSNEARWLEQIPQESSVADGSVHRPLVLDSAPDRAWRPDAYNQSNKAAPENMSSDSLNIQSSWPHQQRPTLITCETDDQHVSKLNAWNMNESLPDRDSMQEDENNLQESRKSESKGTVDIGAGCNAKLWEGQLDVQKNDGQALSSFSNLNDRFGQANSSSNGSQVHNAADGCINKFIPTPGPGMSNIHRERIQQMQNNHQFSQSLSSKKESENQSQQQQTLISSLKHSDNASGEAHECSRVMCYPTIGHGDGLTPDYLYHGQHAMVSTSSALKENAWSFKKPSLSSATEMQKLPMQVVGRNSGLASSHGLPYQPTGELPVNLQQSSSMKRDLFYQGLQHAASGERKPLDLGYMSHTMPVNNAVNSEKGFMDRNLQNSRKGPVDAPASFDEPMAMYPSTDKYKTSQNMLELLSKVDQSTENAPKPFGSEEHGPSSAMSEAGKSNAATAYLQGNQLSSSQGFGLYLAPPSSAPAASKHFLTSDASLQVSTDLNSRHADMGNSDKDKIWLHNQISPQLLQHASDTSQQEYWCHKSGSAVMEQEFSPTINRDINSKLQAKHNVVAALGVHYLRNQLHHQGSSSVSGQAVVEQSANLVTKQADQNKQDRSDAGFSQSEGPQGGPTGELSRRVLQQEAIAKAVPFDLNPHAATDFAGSSASSLLVRDSSGMNRQLPSSISSPYTGNLRQLVHTSEQVPVSQVSGQQGMTQQRSFPTLLQNAWSDMSAQRSMSGTAQKVSTSPLPSVGPATTWVFQTVNDHNLSGRGGSTSEPSPSSSSKHELPSNERLQNRDVPPHQIPYDRAASYGSGSSMGILEHNRHLAGFPLHNQNNVGDREAPDSSLGSKSTNISFQATSESAARSQPNYSLLRQMQTMKSVENDPTKAIKKQKGEDDADVSHMTAKMGEKPVYIYGNSGSSLTPVSQSLRGVEQSHRNYQMATSWFEQFGTYKNGQFVTMSDRFAVPQNSPKPPVQQYFFGRGSESRHPHTVVEQKNVNDANQVGFVASMQVTTSLVPSKDYTFPFSSRPDTNDQSQAIVRHKKRKLATLEQLPWDKVITRTSRKIQSISSVELRWAHATERQVEKIDDDLDFIDDGLLTTGPRRRIIFTNQLVQQIVCPLKAAILSPEANKEYEVVTYVLAKLLLGDACSLISSLAADSQAHTDQDSSASKKPRIFRRLGNQFISKLVEGFLEKSRKLENDFVRLEKGLSLLDIRVECQDLERFSIINRFAKFHGRGPAEGAAAVEGAAPASASVPSSVSSFSYSGAVGVVPRRLFPHRYVTAVPMPRSLPEGMQCHSL